MGALEISLFQSSALYHYISLLYNPVKQEGT